MHLQKTEVCDEFAENPFRRKNTLRQLPLPLVVRVDGFERSDYFVHRVKHEQSFSCRKHRPPTSSVDQAQAMLEWPHSGFPASEKTDE